MGKRNEHDLRRGWGHCGTSMFSHWFAQEAGDKPSRRVSACGRVTFPGWAKGGFDDVSMPPANACPECKKQQDSNG